jgi:hypothetical protein
VAGEYGVSEPVFFKSSFAVNKELYTHPTNVYYYFISLFKNTPTRKKKLFRPDLASANYTKN